MNLTRHSLAVVLLVGAALPAVCLAQAILKEMPADGEIPFGKMVYVDDGKCKKGEVKEVKGGSKDKEIPRQVRCVKRPDPLPQK